MAQWILKKNVLSSSMKVVETLAYDTIALKIQYALAFAFMNQLYSKDEEVKKGTHSSFWYGSFIIYVTMYFTKLLPNLYGKCSIDTSQPFIQQYMNLFIQKPHLTSWATSIATLIQAQECIPKSKIKKFSSFFRFSITIDNILIEGINNIKVILVWHLILQYMTMLPNWLRKPKN